MAYELINFEKCSKEKEKKELPVKIRHDYTKIKYQRRSLTLICVLTHVLDNLFYNIFQDFCVRRENYGQRQQTTVMDEMIIHVNDHMFYELFRP